MDLGFLIPEFPIRVLEKFNPMKLMINGEAREFEQPLTLAAMIENLGMKADRVAVELNRDIAPRDSWASTQLSEGDRIEIVQFVGGGKL